MGKGIVKYRYVILAVFIALIAVSAAFLPTMINKVNYDLTSYLPDDYETSKGATHSSPRPSTSTAMWR